MDFKKEYSNDVLTLIVNLKRATFLEANSFNDILVQEIGNGYRKFIIDLSSCSFADPVFVGVIIVTFKKLSYLKGSLKIIIPEIGFNLEKSTMSSLRLFDTYRSKNMALASFEKKYAETNEKSKFPAGLPSFEVSFST